MRRVLFGVLAVCAVAGPVQAQGLRHKISELFIFGPGEEPLFLAGSANDATLRLHGNHFVPSANQGNATVINFITGSIGGSIANVPVSATSGGATFRFEGGVPVKTSESLGPIFAERAQTLGRGRLLVGINQSNLHFQTLRGVDLNNIGLNFTHENVNFPGCSTQQGDDCAKMGVPVLENDVMQFKLSLDIDLTVRSLLMTYGLSDRIDVGVVVPVVSTSLRGESNAQIIPFGGTSAAHFFGGTSTNPVLSASRIVAGGATGLGDVAARMKINVARSDKVAVAILADARFPTGSENDLLGSGGFAARGMAIVSSRFGDFSPHGNVGFLYRHSAIQNDAVLATAGFDQILAPWATLALDFVSELQVGNSKLVVPGPVVIESPFRRTVQPTTIPDARDDVFNASVGMKFSVAKSLTLITNGLWPLNRGGLRPNAVWTTGLEYSF